MKKQMNGVNGSNQNTFCFEHMRKIWNNNNNNEPYGMEICSYMIWRYTYTHSHTPRLLERELCVCVALWWARNCDNELTAKLLEQKWQKQQPLLPPADEGHTLWLHCTLKYLCPLSDEGYNISKFITYITMMRIIIMVGNNNCNYGPLLGVRRRNKSINGGGAQLLLDTCGKMKNAWLFE